MDHETVNVNNGFFDNHRERKTPPPAERSIVNIELSTAGRIRLSEQIRKQMEALGYGAYRYDKLDLGFELPIAWPADKDSELTLAQLKLLARKLKLKILIGGIDMVPADWSK